MNTLITTSLSQRPCLLMTQLTLYTSGKTVDSISYKMNAIISSMYQWLIDNGVLSFNLAKLKYMLIHSKRTSPSSINITFNGSSIEQVESFKPLGVIMATICTGDPTSTV